MNYFSKTVSDSVSYGQAFGHSQPKRKEWKEFGLVPSF